MPRPGLRVFTFVCHSAKTANHVATAWHLHSDRLERITTFIALKFILQIRLSSHRNITLQRDRFL